jgi:hypothetical protein
MECGGKRSATPPLVFSGLANFEGGVALRLPPHSILPFKILFSELLIC